MNMAKFQTEQLNQKQTKLWYKHMKPFYLVVMLCSPLHPKLFKHWEYGVWKSNIVTHD